MGVVNGNIYLYGFGERMRERLGEYQKGRDLADVKSIKASREFQKVMQLSSVYGISFKKAVHWDRYYGGAVC